jgi:ferredoxin
MKVRVDEARCVGHGLCHIVCPEVFALSDEDGRAIAVDENVPQRLEHDARQAARGCPEEAIQIIE